MQIVKFHFLFISIFCFVLLCSCGRGQASEIMFCDCPYKRLKRNLVTLTSSGFRPGRDTADRVWTQR